MQRTAIALEGAIRRVIDRCQNAADAHDGLEQQDVNVLKLLYLVRYIEDVKANIENIAILMIDDIHTDKIALRYDFFFDRFYHSQYYCSLLDIVLL